jgi:hypothetical protein
MIIILTPIIQKNKITYPVKILDTICNFYIEYNCNYNLELNNNIDGIVCMLIPIAICNKLTIKSDLPIDIKLYENLMKIPDVYKKYHSIHTYLLGHILQDELMLKLDIPVCDRINNNNINITSISLGVDSLYTILKKKDDITHLMYIRNLDASTKINVFEKNVMYVANKYKKNLLIVDSNFKQVIGSLKLYGTNYGVFTGDGIFTASVYPLNISKIIFNGFGTENSFPCLMCQHSDINVFYKSNEFDSQHVDTIRMKKIKYIVENDITFLKILRVCNNNFIPKTTRRISTNDGCFFEGIYNCTDCGKCNRTLAYLYMLNKYNMSTSFKLLNINYLDYFLTKYQHNEEYNKTCLISTKFYNMIFENIYTLYKQDGNFDNIDKYNFFFEDGINKMTLKE